jgi:hypothetical protein
MIRNKKSGNCRKKCLPGQYRSRTSGRCKPIGSGSGGSGSGGSGSGGSGSGGSGSGGSGSGSGGSSSSSGNAFDNALARLGANMPDPFLMFGDNGVMPPGMHGFVPKPADSRRIHSRKMKSKYAEYPIPEPDGSARASVMPHYRPVNVPKYKTVNGVTLLNPDYKPVNVPKYKTVNGVTLLNPDYKPVNVPKYKTVNGVTLLNPDYGKTSSKPFNLDDFKRLHVPSYPGYIGGASAATPDISPSKKTSASVPKYKTVNGVTLLNPDYGKTSSKPLVASLEPVEDGSHWALSYLPPPDRSPPKKTSASVQAGLRNLDDFKRLHVPYYPGYIGGASAATPDISPSKKTSASVLDDLRKHDDFRRLNDPYHPEYRGESPPTPYISGDARSAPPPPPGMQYRTRMKDGNPIILIRNGKPVLEPVTKF